MTCICFSQNNNNISLQPDTVLVDGTGVVQHFCFRVTDQVPSIAKHIVKSKYADSIGVQQDSLLVAKDSVLDLQNIIIELQEDKITNYKNILVDNTKQYYAQRKMIYKQTKQKKFWRSISGILLVCCMAVEWLL